MEKHIKIEKALNGDGTFNYRGIELMDVVAGSQIYLDNENSKDFYAKYKGPMTQLENGLEVALDGVNEITEEQYYLAVAEFQEWLDSLPQPIDQSKEIEQLKQSQASQDELIMSLVLGGEI